MSPFWKTPVLQSFWCTFKSSSDFKGRLHLLCHSEISFSQKKGRFWWQIFKNITYHTNNAVWYKGYSEINELVGVPLTRRRRCQWMSLKMDTHYWAHEARLCINLCIWEQHESRLLLESRCAPCKCVEICLYFGCWFVCTLFLSCRMCLVSVFVVFFAYK